MRRAVELRGILQSMLRRQLQGREHIALALSGGLDSACRARRGAQCAARHADHHVHRRTQREDPEIVRAREAAEFFGTEHRECFLPPEKVPGRDAAARVAHRGSHGSRGSRSAAGARRGDGRARERVSRGPWCRRGVRRHAAPSADVAARSCAAAAARRAERAVRVHAAARGAAVLARPPAGEPCVPRRSAARCRLSSARAASGRHATTTNLEDYCRSTISWIEGMRFHEPVEMACDVTMVMPFFDPAVVQFALSCPTSFLIDARRQKSILRAAVSDLLPPSISQRTQADPAHEARCASLRRAR